MSDAARQKVTIILVTYNSKEIVGNALETIPDGMPTIVVDNASSDGTAEYIRKCFPQVQVIEHPQNIGFGPANNIALEEVETEFSLLMNPDACFIENDTIGKLLSAAENHPEAAILAPGIVNENGVVQRTLPAPLKHRKKINKNSEFSMDNVVGDTCSFSLSGALMLLRMSAFIDAEYFFDPNIFMYFEDDDICMSCRGRGFTTMLIPSINVMHLEGRSSPPSLEVEALKLRHKTFSQLYMMDKAGVCVGAKALRVVVKGLSICVLGFFLLNKRKFFIERARTQGAFRYLRQAAQHR